MASESEIIGYADGEPIYAEGPLSFGEGVPRGGYVYFIQASHGGPIKIGYSVSPEWRLKELQAGSPYLLVLRKTVKGTRTRESRLHKRFAEDRLGGEWFVQSPELVELACAQEGEGRPVPRPRLRERTRAGQLASREAEDAKRRFAQVAKEARAHGRERQARGLRSFR